MKDESSGAWATAQAHSAKQTPMRRLASALRDGRVRSGLKRRMKPVIQAAAAAARRHPLLSQGARLILRSIPSLERRIHAVLHGARIAPESLDLHTLSPDAAIVVRQLRQSQRGTEDF